MIMQPVLSRRFHSEQDNTSDGEFYIYVLLYLGSRGGQNDSQEDYKLAG